MKIDDILIGDIISYDDEVIHSLFIEDEEYYYDILNDNKEYDKDSDDEIDTSVQIKDKLVNHLPYVNKEYELSVSDVIMILPKDIYDHITFNPLKEDVKVKRLLYDLYEYNDD